MWFTTASNQAQYRITFFFGPEPVPGQSTHVSCLFNVKKRSWKGGIQVAVEVSHEQIARARQTLAFSDQLTKALAGVPSDERVSFRERADDLLVQAVCGCKLESALASGLIQENQRILVDRFGDQLEHVLTDNRTAILSHILRELDLIDAPDPAGSL